MYKNQKEKGTQQYKKNNFHKAIQHYTNYLQSQHPDNIQALLNIALCYFKVQQFHKAIQVCDEVVSMDQKYFKCYYRRAMCRKQILAINPHDLLQKYKFIYDCKMFEKFCNKDEVSKQLSELISFAENNREQLLSCTSCIRSIFQRDLLQIEKDNIKTFALSWLEQKSNRIKQNIKQDKRQKINNLYKQLNSLQKKTKDQQQIKTVRQLIRNKIKILKSEMLVEKSLINQEKNKNDQVKGNINQQPQQNNNQQLLIHQNKQGQLSKPNVQQDTDVSKESQQTKRKKKAVDEQLKKVQIQKIKVQQSSIKQKKVEQLTMQLLFKKYFVQGLQKSRDVILQFGNNLVVVLSNESISKEKKEQLLIKIQKVKKYQIKLLSKSNLKEIKQKINQALSKLQIKQELRMLFTFQ